MPDILDFLNNFLPLWGGDDDMEVYRVFALLMPDLGPLGSRNPEKKRKAFLRISSTLDAAGWDRLRFFKAYARAIWPFAEMPELNSGLDKLESWNERQACIVVFRSALGLSVQQIAGLLDLSVKTVQEEYKYALHFLAGVVD